MTPARFATVISAAPPLWSPASLSPVVWLTAGPTWCFTDAGATTPCGDGDLIYTWVNRGSGGNFVQATSGLRPTLRSISGKWRAVWDGTGKVMQQTSAPGWSSITVSMACVATRADSPVGDEYELIYWGNDAAYSPNYANFSLFVWPSSFSPPGGQNSIFADGYDGGAGGGGIGTTPTTVAVDTLFSAVGSINTSGQNRLYMNSTSYGPVSGIAVSVSASAKLTLGRRGESAGSGRLNGSLAEVLIDPVAYSPATMALISSYFSRQWGTP